MAVTRYPVYFFVGLSLFLWAASSTALPTEPSKSERMQLEEVVEQVKGIDPNSEAGRLFQARMEDLAIRLLGEDFVRENKPVFVLYESLDANAFFLKNTDRPSFFFSTALIGMTEVVDDLAFVFGHEYGHWHFEVQHASERNSKLEEQTADLRSVQLMLDAGMDPTRAYEFMKIILNRGNLSSSQDVSDAENNSETVENEELKEKMERERERQELFDRILQLGDPHPVTSERLRAMQLALTGLENRRGRLTREPLRWDQEEKAMFLSAEATENIVWIELDRLQGNRELSLEERAEVFLQLIQSDIGWTGQRANSMIKELESFLKDLNSEMFKNFKFVGLDEIQGDPELIRQDIERRNRLFTDMANAFLAHLSTTKDDFHLSQIYIQSFGQQFYWDPSEVVKVAEGLARVRQQFHLFPSEIENDYSDGKRDYLVAEDEENFTLDEDGQIQKVRSQGRDLIISDIQKNRLLLDLEELESIRSQNLSYLQATDRNFEREFSRAMVPPFFIHEDLLEAFRPNDLEKLRELESPAPEEVDVLEKISRPRPAFALSGQADSTSLVWPTDFVNDLAQLQRRLRFLRGAIDEDLVELLKGIEKLFESRTKEEAELWAERIVKFFAQTELSHELTSRLFEARGLSSRANQEVAWNHLIPFLQESPLILRALWQLGIHEKRVISAIPRDELIDYLMEGDGHEIYFSPRGVLSISIDSKGLVADRSGLVAADPYGDALKALYRSLFVQALADPSLQERILQLIEKHPPTHDLFQFEAFFYDLPELVIAYNRHLFLSERDQFALERFANLFRQGLQTNPERTREAVRGFFLSQNDRSFYALNLDEGQKRLDLKNPLIKLLIEMPIDVMSLEERSKLLLSALESSDFQEAGYLLASRYQADLDIDNLKSLRDEIMSPRLEGSEFFLRSLVEAHLDEFGIFDPIELLEASMGQIPFEMREGVADQLQNIDLPTELDKLIDLNIFVGVTSLQSFDYPRWDQVMIDIVDRLKSLEDPERRLDLIARIVRGPSLQDPAIRNSLTELYAKSLREHLGIDNASDEYLARLEVELERLGGSSHEQALSFWMAAAKEIQLQERTWLIVRSKFSGLSALQMSKANDALMTNEIQRLVMLGYGPDIGSHVMAEDSAAYEIVDSMESNKIGEVTIEFLLSPLTEKSIQDFLTEGGGYAILDTTGLHRQDLESYRKMSETRHSDQDPRTQTRIQLLQDRVMEAGLVSPTEKYRQRARYLYENFWASNLPVRASYLDTLLHPNALQTTNHDFLDSVRRVVDRVIPGGEAHSEDARRILINYITLLPEYQQGVTLAALLAAERSAVEQGDSGMGARLGLLLDMKGPAEAKLGQSIHSFPETPEEIRDGLGRLKADRDISRVELLEVYRRRVPPELRDQIAHVGQTLGVASYYIVVEVEMKDGSKKALRILQQNAREIADLGFEYLELLAQKEGSSEVGRTLARMIEHARSQLDLETDTSVGQQQTASAREIYEGVKIVVDGDVFEFKTYPFLEVGEGYALLDLAPGARFNDLPDTEERRRLAEAYFRFELEQILSGRRFDHDRHGSQILVDGRQIAILDHGGLALNEPTSEQREALGGLLSRVIGVMASSEASRNSLMRAFQEEIQARANEDRSTLEYLVSVQRALLALGDFYSAMNPEDSSKTDAAFMGHLKQIIAEKKIHPEILKGFWSGNRGANSLNLLKCAGKLKKLARKIKILHPISSR